MGKPDYEPVALGVVGVVAVLAVAALLYGMFIYNHSQDVSRDKFLIEHCAQVEQENNSAYTNAKSFECKAKD